MPQQVTRTHLHPLCTLSPRGFALTHSSLHGWKILMRHLELLSSGTSLQCCQEVLKTEDMLEGVILLGYREGYMSPSVRRLGGNSMLAIEFWSRY